MSDNINSLIEKEETVESNLKSFTDDTEKMIDFIELSREEFLASYSYLTEQEYDDTLKDLSEPETREKVFNDVTDLLSDYMTDAQETLCEAFSGEEKEWAEQKVERIERSAEKLDDWYRNGGVVESDALPPFRVDNESCFSQGFYHEQKSEQRGKER